MKLPDAFSKFLKKSEDGKEYFFSLYLDTDAAAVAVWHAEKGLPHIDSFAHGGIAEDSWDARIRVVDRLLSAAEEKVSPAKPIAKTVFGLPPAYLTPEGDIADAVRPGLKKLTRMLELTPLGFVPLTQAIAFSLKQDEGVPPSVILVNGSRKTSHISLYRVGKRTGDEEVLLGEDPSLVLETVLKKQQDGDVLPSRILLYGSNAATLEDIRSKLLKHPWPSRVNFLHFPKVTAISLESLLRAVSLAGAAELSSEFVDMEETGTVSAAVAQPLYTEHARSSDPDEEEESIPDKEEDSGVEVPDLPDEDMDEDDIEREEPVATEASDDEIANVEMVTPESLGFRKRDVLEQPVRTMPVHQGRVRAETHTAGESEDDVPDHAIRQGKKRGGFAFRMPSVSPALFSSLFDRMPQFRVPRSGVKLPLIIGSVIVIAILVLLSYFVPRVTITVLVSPQTLEEETTLTVDTDAAVADPAGEVIPGRTLTQSVSGEKTIAVTGTKNIGDPAKGSVTIYNKITAQKTFSKGTVITGNGLKFTLDSDVSVASASESIGSITFGKATADVTAEEIGPNGNLPSGIEFTIAGTGGSQASARNDEAFTGGSSKKVTVVSRADQDTLVKDLTAELVEKAQAQLAQSATGGEQLIEDTVETEVTEKTFNAEINEEASQLTGSVTVTVTGISMRDSDVQSVLTSLVAEKVPDGYALNPDDISVRVSDVTVNKDETITVDAKLSSIALPQVDEVSLKKKLAGKDRNTAESILMEGRGVVGAEYRFGLLSFSGRMPWNPSNISLTVKVQ